MLDLPFDGLDPTAYVFDKKLIILFIIVKKFHIYYSYKIKDNEKQIFIISHFGLLINIVLEG